MPRDPSAPRPSALGIVPLVAAAALAAAVARFPILTPDVWWHLATGRLVAANGIPHVDPFSWMLAGRAWTVHEWLADLVLHACDAAGGLLGVVALRAALLVLGAVASYRLARLHAGLLVALPLAVAAAWASQRNWLDRPQLWSYALVPLVLLVLERQRQETRLAFLLPVLFLLWVNLHGGFMLGLGLVFLWTAARWVEERGTPAMRRAAWGAAACAVATVANPNGLRGALYPLHYVGVGLGETIQEERPGALDGPHAWVAFAILVGLVALTVADLLRRPRRVPLPHAAVALVLAWLAMPQFAGIALPLAAERHAPLLLFGATPLLAWRLGAWLGAPMLHFESRVATALRHPSAWLATSVLAAFALWQTVRVWPHDGSPRARLLPGRFPVAGASWLARTALPPRLLNPYRWGGYLVYRLAPRYQVWIDSRGDLYGAEQLRDDEILYRMSPGTEPEVQALLSRDDPDVIVWYLLTVDFGSLQVHPFARWLLARPQMWRLVFVDGVDPAAPDAPWATTAIFLRVHPRNSGRLEALPAVPLPPGLPP
jgi:hypothetical protein